MDTMKRRTSLKTVAVVLLALLAGCGPGPEPELARQSPLPPALAARAERQRAEFEADGGIEAEQGARDTEQQTPAQRGEVAEAEAQWTYLAAHDTAIRLGYDLDVTVSCDDGAPVVTITPRRGEIVHDEVAMRWPGYSSGGVFARRRVHPARLTGDRQSLVLGARFARLLASRPEWVIHVFVGIRPPDATMVTEIVDLAGAAAAIERLPCVE